MPRTPGGVHCSRCDRDVVDLRRVPRKRALSILAEKREQGRVCAWVRATEDGSPVFTPDPSRLARLAGPAIVASALVACSPATSTAHTATQVTLAHQAPVEPTSGGNANATTPVIVTVTQAPPAPIQPASNIQPVIVEMAGDMAF